MYILLKNRLFSYFGLFLLLVGFSAACSKSSNDNPPGNTNPEDTSKVTTYINPVFEPILADPSIIRAADGWFYAYGTQDDWGDGKGSRIVPIIRSKDLVQWYYTGTAFQSLPSWKTTGGGIWAVNVVKMENKYFMYYSYSIWADPNPGVGLAISNTPYGPFKDLGKLYLSSEIGIANGIDPFYIEANEKKYLFCGSYSNKANQGIYAFELTEDGKSIKDPSQKIKITAGDFEGAMIHKRGAYYYFFGSKGGCCNGAASTYHLCVARSKSLFGPYLDKDGNSITERGNGTLLIQGNDTYAGPGHCARIITDKKGTDWLVYHAIKKSNPKVSSGASRRSLMIDKLTWASDGWPKIEGRSPSEIKQDAPLF